MTIRLKTPWAERTRSCVGAILCSAILAISAAGHLAAQTASERGAEWDKTLALAKKEGAVSVAIGSTTTRETRPVWRAFEDKFGIKVVVSGGSGQKVTQRMLAEHKLGRPQVDLVGIGVPSLLTQLLPNNVLAPIAPSLFLPEVLDTSKFWDGKLWFADPEEKYLIMFNLAPEFPGIGINTNLVKEEDLNSYWDVFDPRYAGQYVSGTTQVSQGANTILRMMVLTGPDWLARWIQAKPIYVAESSVGVNYLIEGRAGIGMFLGGELDQLVELREQGAPVKLVTRQMKEGQSAGSGNCCFSLVANPPHPNAQKLLINWLMSREGQIILQDSVPRSNSPREDIPKDKLEPAVQRIAGVKYIVLSQRPNTNDLLKQGQDAIEKAKTGMK